MANTYNLVGILATGTLAARPSATTVATGSLYAATDTGVIYQSNGATWSVWATVTGTASGPATNAAGLVFAATSFR